MDSTMTDVHIYTGLVSVAFLLILMNYIIYYVICMNSSISIHNGMSRAILRAPMNFFDMNPTGKRATCILS